MTATAASAPAAPPGAPCFADRLARLLAGPCAILYLGASVTAQQKSYCHALHAQLCRVTGHEHGFHRQAMGGGSSAYALAAMLRAMREADTRYDIVFLETLTGDLNLLVPDAVVPSVLAATADVVRAQGGELCILKLPRMDRPADHAVTLAYDAAAAALGLPVVDVTGFGRPAVQAGALARHVLRDGIHTSEMGSELLGAAVLSQLLAPDAPWPAAEAAEGYAQPLRGRFPQLRLVLDDLAWAQTEGSRRDSFRAAPDNEVFPVVVAPHGAPLAFSFPGYVAYFLFVSAPDASLIDLDFHGVVRRTPLLDRHGHFPHLHMKPIFREFRATDLIRMTALDELPDPNPVPEALRRHLVADKAVRFLGVLGMPDG
jgi:hypothetical protein